MKPPLVASIELVWLAPLASVVAVGCLRPCCCIVVIGRSAFWLSVFATTCGEPAVRKPYGLALVGRFAELVDEDEDEDDETEVIVGPAGGAVNGGVFAGAPKPAELAAVVRAAVAGDTPSADQLSSCEEAGGVGDGELGPAEAEISKSELDTAVVLVALGLADEKPPWSMLLMRLPAAG